MDNGSSLVQKQTRRVCLCWTLAHADTAHVKAAVMQLPPGTRDECEGDELPLHTLGHGLIFDRVRTSLLLNESSVVIFTSRM